MNKVFFSILLLISSVVTLAQKQTKKAMLDSLKQNDETMEMLGDMDKPLSYVKIGVGIGNQLFSVHNKALDASQTNTNLVLTPSIGYYHKSFSTTTSKVTNLFSCAC